MAIYRFLASVKLAVITIFSLAMSLASATIIEKWYGTKAVQELVYESRWFSILLAFLAVNILCAATIRIPWKRRQTGFVVTHAGLLTLIFGAWYGFTFSDEGTTAATASGVMDHMVLTRHPIIRVREVDRRTGRPGAEYELPFNGGAFPWPKGKHELISKPKDPFQVEIVNYYEASAPEIVHVPAKRGMPMVRLSGRAKPPRLDTFMDLFPDAEESWLTIPEATVGYRAFRRAGGAKFAFMYVDRPELLDDFLRPPKNPGILGVVRIRYDDSTGKPRMHEVRLDDLSPSKPFPLPDSDLTIAFLGADAFESPRDVASKYGDDEVYVVKLLVRKGNGPALDHIMLAGQPMFRTRVMPPLGGAPQEALVNLSYYRPPLLADSNTGNKGTFGVIEVLGDAKGDLYYRVFSRDQTPPPPDQAGLPRPGILKNPPAALKLGEKVPAFGGGSNQAMTLEFGVEKYLVSGEEKPVYVHVDLPEGSKDDGMPAALARLTVGSETKEVWVPWTQGIGDSVFELVSFADADYQVAYDLQRKNFGFSLTLDEPDTDFYPGTQSASAYSSAVRLTDPALKIEDRKILISMNRPLTHGKFTFYQSGMNVVPKVDKRTGRRTKATQSVLAVGHDAGREIKYIGCVLVVLGTFIQFYMRAGVATLIIGAKATPETSAEKARLRLAKKAAGADATSAKEAKPSAPPTNHDDAIL
jgi:hypothetical protein